MSDQWSPVEVTGDSAIVFEKRAYLIALIGNDGAGKTTQALRLVEWLRAERQAAALHRNESLQPIRTALDTVAATMGCRDAEALVGREAAQLAYVAVKWNAMVKMRELLGQEDLYLVVDRYAYCHVASVRSQRLENAAIVEQLFKIFPKPDVTFYLDVTPETAIRRMIQRNPHVPPMSRDYLEAHARAYWMLDAAAEFVRVDGEKSIDEVQDRLRKEVTRRCLTPSVMSG